MTRTKSRIGASAVVCVGCALVVAACDAGTTSSLEPGGGSAGVAGHAGTGPSAGGSNSVAGSSGTAGSAGSVIGGAGGAGGTGGAANNCTKLPASLLLTDFSPATFKATDNTTWKTSKADLWGSAMSLTGGDVFYQGKAESAASVTLHGQTLTITASVAAGDYMGYMFNFKPACTNASGTTGLRFDVLPDSTVGNATLKVQMQQKSDYPSTANPGSRPGDCVPTSVETQYNDCLSPVTTVVSSGNALTSGTVDLPWTSFSGGQPVSALDSGQLMAIQWQFECPAEGGAIVSSGGAGGMGGGGLGGSSAGGVGGGSAGAGGATGGVGAGGSSAGTSGASGSSGSAGANAGSGGGSGSGAGGTSGSSGTAGSSAGGESGGSSGTAGSSASAGSGGTAGSSTAGSGGSGSTTPTPCVVSLTIDNVTFY